MTDELDRIELLEIGEEMFAELEEIDKRATPAPWYVRWFDDEMCTNGYVVSTVDAGGVHEEGNYPSEWDPTEMIAATLIQTSGSVSPRKGSPGANSFLIALLRNQLPELIRLARIGYEAEKNKA